jgi:hypothetical protein
MTPAESLAVLRVVVRMGLERLYAELDLALNAYPGLDVEVEIVTEGEAPMARVLVVHMGSGDFGRVVIELSQPRVAMRRDLIRTFHQVQHNVNAAAIEAETWRMTVERKKG